MPMHSCRVQWSDIRFQALLHSALLAREKVSQFTWNKMVASKPNDDLVSALTVLRQEACMDITTICIHTGIVNSGPHLYTDNAPTKIAIPQA